VDLMVLAQQAAAGAGLTQLGAGPSGAAATSGSDHAAATAAVVKRLTGAQCVVKQLEECRTQMQKKFGEHHLA
jgi:hypothetical protein